MDPKDLANRLKLIAVAINTAANEGADRHALVEEVVAGRIKDADDVPKVARELHQRGGARRRRRTRGRPMPSGGRAPRQG